jgi:hypothetical protein
MQYSSCFFFKHYRDGKRLLLCLPSHFGKTTPDTYVRVCHKETALSYVLIVDMFICFLK